MTVQSAWHQFSPRRLGYGPHQPHIYKDDNGYWRVTVDPVRPRNRRKADKEKWAAAYKFVAERNARRA